MRPHGNRDLDLWHLAMILARVYCRIPRHMTVHLSTETEYTHPDCPMLACHQLPIASSPPRVASACSSLGGRVCGSVPGGRPRRRRHTHADLAAHAPGAPLNCLD